MLIYVWAYLLFLFIYCCHRIFRRIKIISYQYASSRIATDSETGRQTDRQTNIRSNKHIAHQSSPNFYARYLRPKLGPALRCNTLCTVRYGPLCPDMQFSTECATRNVFVLSFYDEDTFPYARWRLPYRAGLRGHIKCLRQKGRRSLSTRKRECVCGVAWWRNGRALDLRSRGGEFDPRPGRGCVRRLWASCSHPIASTLTVFVTV